MRRSATLLLALAVLLPACSDDGGDDTTAVDDTATTEDTAAEDTTTTAEDTTTTTSGEAPAGEGSATADAYAEDVCAAIGDWYGDINDASTALVDEATAAGQDPAAGKDLVLGFLDQAIGFTDDLVTDLEAAGAPDTEAGQQTADDLVTGIQDVRELFQGARDDTAALPADDPEALRAGLEDIGAALQESATAVSANFQAVLSSVDDPALATAFQEAAACQDLATVGAG